MCFNYSLNTTIKSLESRFAVKSFKKSLEPAYHINAFTFPVMPVIKNNSREEISFLNWGLIPNWVSTRTKADEIKKFTLNARSETIFEKASFKESIVSKRCLIPATGFFEWQHNNKEKVPYYIFLKDQSIFSFAGIWDQYTNEFNEVIQSFSIITSEANSFMASIHNKKKRMPVILTPDQESLWLNENLNEEHIQEMMQKKNIDFEAYTINKSLNNPKVNSNTSEIFQKFNYQENTLGF